MFAYTVLGLLTTKLLIDVIITEAFAVVIIVCFVAKSQIFIPRLREISFNLIKTLDSSPCYDRMLLYPRAL